MCGDPQDLTVLTHSVPTPRSSDLGRAGAGGNTRRPEPLSWRRCSVDRQERRRQCPDPVYVTAARGLYGRRGAFRGVGGMGVNPADDPAVADVFLEMPPELAVRIIGQEAVQRTLGHRQIGKAHV